MDELDPRDPFGTSKPDKDDDPQSGTKTKPGTIYSLIVGVVFVGVIAFAGINSIKTNGGGVLGAKFEGDMPLAQFAVPDARGTLDGDANIAQDDCKSSAIPCPSDDVRTPACKVNLEGALRVCDYFDKPLALSFWFTKGGDCETQQDVFEAAYKRFGKQVNFLAIDVRDDRQTVQDLIDEHKWTHPVGLDTDGALSNLYRVGGCPTIVYAFPGGITHDVSIGQLEVGELDKRIEELMSASQARAEGRPANAGPGTAGADK